MIWLGRRDPGDLIGDIMLNPKQWRDGLGRNGAAAEMTSVR
jgi:hypothetical protein